MTASDSGVTLGQDADGEMAQAQTFRTVAGLSGNGISFESVLLPGMYLTLSGGEASLTDGADAAAASFQVTTK